MRHATVAVALLAVGCQERPDPVESLAACADAPCRAEWIAAAWIQSPESTWELILTEPSELDRTVLVTRLASDVPGALEGRCDQIPMGSARSRCMRLTRRPHLQPHHASAIRNQRDSPGREAPGPRSAYPPLPADPPVVEETDCHGEEKDECLFRTAEASVVRDGVEGLRDALGLCAMSAYGPRCVGHLLELASPPAPPSDAAAERDVVAAIQAVAEIRSIAGDEGIADQWEDFVWSLWLTTAYDEADEIRGDLLDLLPPSAAPQLRYAAAWKHARAQSSTHFDLDSTSGQLTEALARRSPTPAQSPALYPAATTHSRHGWNGERRGEGTVPAAFCMGTTRRAMDPDPDLDLRIAILEARARLAKAPPADDFLALVGSEEPEVLRWSGARLGAMLDPEAARALLASMQQTETPLVLGRLEPAKGPKSPGGLGVPHRTDEK